MAYLIYALSSDQAHNFEDESLNFMPYGGIKKKKRASEIEDSQYIEDSFDFQDYENFIEEGR